MLRGIIERGWKATLFFFFFFASRNSVIPNITRILVAFTSCFNPEEMDLAGRVSCYLGNYRSDFFLPRRKKKKKSVVLSLEYGNGYTKRKTKRKRKFFDAIFISCRNYQVSGTSRPTRATTRKQTSTYYVDAHAITVIINASRI